MTQKVRFNINLSGLPEVEDDQKVVFFQQEVYMLLIPPAQMLQNRIRWVQTLRRFEDLDRLCYGEKMSLIKMVQGMKFSVHQTKIEVVLGQPVKKLAQYGLPGQQI